MGTLRISCSKFSKYHDDSYSLTLILFCRYFLCAILVWAGASSVREEAFFYAVYHFLFLCLALFAFRVSFYHIWSDRLFKTYFRLTQEFLMKWSACAFQISLLFYQFILYHAGGGSKSFWPEILRKLLKESHGPRKITKKNIKAFSKRVTRS